MRFYEDRRLIYALALSVAVHAVLLLDVVRVYPPELGAPALAMKVVIEQKRLSEPVKTVQARQEAPDEAPKPRRVPPAEPGKARSSTPEPEKRRAEPESPRIAVREASPVIAPSVTELSLIHI